MFTNRYALPCIAAFAFSGMAGSAIAEMNSTAVDIEIGIRQTSQDLDWNIASDLSGSSTPNVLSELQYYDMDVTHLYASLEIPVFRRLMFRAMADYGVISDGQVIDSDYFGNNRTNVFSISNSTIDGDTTLDAEIGFGWQFNFSFEVPLWRIGDSDRRVALSSDISITPEIGYSLQQQNLQFIDGIQVFPAFGPFEGLNSEYDAEFSGLFAGLRTRIRLAGPVRLTASYMHVPFADMRADASWNLRSDFQQDPSFIHIAEGDGSRLNVGIEWAFGKSEDKIVSVNYEDLDFSAGDGTDETRFSDGGVIFIRLNEISRRSHGWSLSFSWRF